MILRPMAATRKSDDQHEALGLLETRGLVAAIEATDAMLKAARVRLISQERTVPGLITCKIGGETAAVRSAIDAGRAAAERVGTVISAHVIPRPAAQIRDEFGAESPAQKAASAPKQSDLSSLTVVELRRIAREQDDKNFSGRMISRASKKQLLAFLKGS